MAIAFFNNQTMKYCLILGSNPGIYPNTIWKALNIPWRLTYACVIFKKKFPNFAQQSMDYMSWQSSSLYLS